jgi:membrane-associated phospholipid phosphatase
MFAKKTYYSLIALGVVFIFFGYFYLDIPIAKYFITHKYEYQEIGKLFSIAGQSQWYIVPGLFGFLFFRYYKSNELYAQRFLFLFNVNVFSGLLSIVLKTLFGRIRPWGLKHGGDQYGFLLFEHFNLGLWDKIKYQFEAIKHATATYASFPSGHSTTMFAMFVFMSAMFPRYKYLWFFLAALVAISRILAEDHFFSDIIAGAILGTVSSVYVYNKMKAKIKL